MSYLAVVIVVAAGKREKIAVYRAVPKRKEEEKATARISTCCPPLQIYRHDPIVS